MNEVWNLDVIYRGFDDPAFAADMEKLEAGLSLNNIDKFLPLIYPQPATLLDYLPDELDHIPYGMDNVLWENRGRVKLSEALLAQLEGQPAEDKGDEDS